MPRSFTSAFLYMYIFFVSWTGAFLLHAWVPLHVFCIITASGLYMIKTAFNISIPKRLYPIEDIFIVIGFFTIAVGVAFRVNPKTMNYILAYLYVFFIGYFMLKLLLYKECSIQSILKVNMFAVLFVSCFAILDVVLILTGGIDLQALIPRVIPADATYLGFIPRAYSFSNEPTILAYYLNCLGPLAVYRILYSSVGCIKYLGVLIVFLAWLATLSTAGFAFLIISVLFVICLKQINKRRVNYRIESLYFISFMVMLLLLCLIAFSTTEYTVIVKESISPIVEKLTFSGNSSIDHEGSRMKRWAYSLERIEENPMFGKGLGFLSDQEMGGSTNWYLALAVDSGILAVIAFLVFLGITFIRIIKSNIRLKYWILCGFIAGILHFNVISLIQDPFLWVLIAFFHICRLNSAQMNSNITKAYINASNNNG